VLPLSQFGYNGLSMNNREFRDYLRQKRLEALRTGVQAERKPPVSENAPMKVRRKAR
jgi:hypothetical protein